MKIKSNNKTKINNHNKNNKKNIKIKIKTITNNRINKNKRTIHHSRMKRQESIQWANFTNMLTEGTDL